MSDNTKILLVILIFVVWGVFVYLGLTPAKEFIQTLRDALIGLGVFQATIAVPKN